MKATGFTKGIILGVLPLTIIILVLVASACSSSNSPAASGATSLTASPAASGLLVTTYDAVPTVAAIDFVDPVKTILPSVVAISGDFGGQQGAGTGWIIDKNGLIVTNDHVVSGASSVKVTLHDGSTYTPTAIEGDSASDLAVLKIDAANLTPAALGNSAQLQMGQPVAAVGNALNMGIRVTSGVVSRLNVTITYQNNLTLQGLIETDAVLNPGNSGGVLIDRSARVVGITNAGLFSPVSDAEGFGYAIAINDAMPVINSLISRLP